MKLVDWIIVAIFIVDLAGLSLNLYLAFGR